MAAECTICARDVPDTAYACAKCGDKARSWLTTIAEVAGPARDIAHGERLRGAPAAVGTSIEAPLPINPSARQRFDAASNAVITWARHVSETRGTPVTDLLAVAAWWLLGHIEWLRHRKEVREAFADLKQAWITLQRLADRPPDLVVVGACECGVVLYARARASVARCRDCGSSWDVARSRQTLRAHLDGMLLTAAEIATMAVIGDPDANRTRVRKLINQWASRGRITPHGQGPDGEQRYRFGEVNALLGESHAKAS